jgi:hypothetical protein
VLETAGGPQIRVAVTRRGDLVGMRVAEKTRAGKRGSCRHAPKHRA